MNRTRLLALLLAAMMTVPAQMTAAAAQPQTAVQTGPVAVTQEDKSVETSLSSLETVSYTHLRYSLQTLTLKKRS